MNQPLFRLFLFAAFLGFSGYTGWLIVAEGYTSVFEVAFGSLAGIQLYLDLSLALVLISLWMIQDSHQRAGHHRRVLPFLLLTLVLGIIGPLLYLLLTPRAAASA